MMCSECWQHPCHPSCPNADEPRAIYECDLCGYPIYEGDEMWVIQGDRYCAECIDESKTYANQ